MATRIDKMAPRPLRRTEVSENLAGNPAPFPPTRLVGPARDEAHFATTWTIEQMPRHAAALVVQRCMDLTLAMLCLLILWPVMLAAAIMVVMSGPGPVFYSQRRFGRDGVIFDCFKFRTMQVDADRLLRELLESSPAIKEIWKRDRKLRDDPRITYCGRFLRRYSIDELPQLFNVIRGEMSVVGPRPLATDEAHFYTDAFSAYCSLKPGITGPWQVGGRNKITFEGRAQLDYEYARTKSVGQDIRILLKTIPVVLRGTGY
ncbi:sugar transferase [Sphingobium mellinum]|uniref:sugar transferase n=1 Tax=Sphingobium mellinum TaxID=1387166 RepID=UPI0030EEBDBA